jgi:hypothetical protein
MSSLYKFAHYSSRKANDDSAHSKEALQLRYYPLISTKGNTKLDSRAVN